MQNTDSSFNREQYGLRRLHKPTLLYLDWIYDIFFFTCNWHIRQMIFLKVPLSREGSSKNIFNDGNGTPFGVF